MAINKINYRRLFFILLTAFCGVLLTGCPSPCIQANYSFSYNALIYPEADTLHLGDSLFIQSTFPTNIQELQSGKTVDYENAIIGSTLGLGELVEGDTIAKGAWRSFKYQALNGKIYKDNSIPSPEFFMQIEFGELSGYYKLKVILIPQKSGIYVISLGNGLGKAKNKKNCDKATFEASISNTNHHEYHYFNWSNDGAYQEGLKRSYYFVVE